MRLVFDTTVLAQGARSERARTGIYRYASQLLTALDHSCGLQFAGYCRDPLLRLWQSDTAMPGRAGHPLKYLVADSAVVRTVKPLWRALQATPWTRHHQRNHLANLLKESGIKPEHAIYHSPYAAIPPEVRQAGFGGVVLTIHDMLPLIAPQLFPRETVRCFRAGLASLRPKDHLLCVSRATRDDVVRLQNTVPATQVHVAPLAAAAEIVPVRDDAVLGALRQRLALEPGDRIILSVGTLEPRKNLALTLEAVRRLRSRHPGSPFRLLLVGARGWKIEPLLLRPEADDLANVIHLAGFIEDELLAALYCCAEVFVYPSLYEGFGLPPLEAMRCGTPVIVGRSSSLSELVGTAGLQVDPYDPDELCAALEQVLLEPSTHRILKFRGLQRAQDFNWHKTAVTTAEVYRLALDKS